MYMVLCCQIEFLFCAGADGIRPLYNDTQDFTQLKVAQGACYPFDKELLQVG